MNGRRQVFPQYAREVGLQTWVSSLDKDAHALSKIKIELSDRRGLYEQGQ